MDWTVTRIPGCSDEPGMTGPLAGSGKKRIFTSCIKSALWAANRAARSHGGKGMRIVQSKKSMVL